MQPSTQLDHNVVEPRHCAEINPNYRGLIYLFCWEGQLYVDYADCRPQWVAYGPSPWTGRAHHTALTLHDGKARPLNQGLNML